MSIEPGDAVPREDYENLTDADFEGLEPLVPAGADRQPILDEVVERWANQTHDLPREIAALSVRTDGF
ncbi:MAG: hypothetical protein AAGI68_09775 [Planctomycetota bacterium]